MKDRIFKIKEYLNYIPMIIDQNTLSNPKDIVKFYEKLYTKETTFKAATVEFLSKISNRKKIYNERFKLC